MKKAFLILISILLVTAAPYAAALASDISGANYTGTIQATNSGAEATNVAANFTLSTSALITARQLDPNALNVVARDDSGNDIGVMPSDGSNPWVLFFDNIPAGASRNAYIYIGDVTGGKIRYFGASGITVRDAITAEGNDFEWYLKGVRLTSGTGASQYLLNHSDGAGGLQIFKSDTVSQNVTLKVLTPTSTTIYSSTSDGWLKCNNATYATAQAAASATTADDTSPVTYVGQSKAATYDVHRAVFYFDTSSIPDDAIIGSANLMLYGTGDFSTTNFDITIQNGQPTYPHDPMAATDYNKTYYSGTGGTLNTGSFVTANYNTIPLNSTGLTWISKTGTTKLMLRSSKDISASAPTGDEFIEVQTSEQAGTKDPKLVVTYLAATDLSITNATSTSEHDYRASLSGGTLSFQQDSDTPETTAFAGSIPNPASDITLFENDACIYAESATYTQGGSTFGPWVWEYPDEMASTLTNGTGTANGSPITLALGNNTVTVTGAGTFTIRNAFGWHVKAVSGTAAVTGSPKYCPSPAARGETLDTEITVVGTGTITVTVQRVLTDQSANSYDAAATFRTTSSDADVSALLTYFGPTEEAVPEQSLISDWPEMITDVPEEPSSMYTEETLPGIFFAPLIHAIWPDSIPESIFWYNFAFSIIIGAGVLTFYLMASKGQNGLFLKIIVMLAIMIFWSVPGPNIYGMYVDIYFIFWSFGVLVLSRNYGW